MVIYKILLQVLMLLKRKIGSVLILISCICEINNYYDFNIWHTILIIMKTFWFKKPIRKQYNFRYMLNISPVFLVMLIFSFSFFCMINRIGSVLWSVNQLSILKDNLKDMAILVFPTDKKMSQSLLSLRSIIQSHEQWKNIFQSNEADMYYLIKYFQSKLNDIESLESVIQKFTGKEYNLWLTKYRPFLETFWQTLFYKDDLFSLLWKTWPQKYMIVLQNTWEKRPNWWFFGSFALLTLNWTKFDVEVIDSYKLIYLNPNAKVQTPSWATDIVPDSDFGFISSNKFWFTDLDWENLKEIYEKVYPSDKIRWVIFVKSDYFEQIIPWFAEKLYEWQFVNASVDLIRWDKSINKKEFYLKEVNSYLQSQKNQILKNMLEKFYLLWQDNNINAYFTDISTDFQQFLYNKWYVNIYDEKKIYFWDKNIWYNKIDRFVTKTIFVEDEEWNLILDEYWDILEVDKLIPWKYNIKVVYDLNIPNSYIDLMNNLSEKYDIQLTDREDVILWLRIFWDNEWMIYLPPNFKVSKVVGSPYKHKIFQTDFSNNIKYYIKSTRNNVMRYVQFDVEVE